MRLYYEVEISKPNKEINKLLAIDLGIYNFTTNLNGIKYLLNKPNTLKEVEPIKKMVHTEESKEYRIGCVTALCNYWSGWR